MGNFMNYGEIEQLDLVFYKGCDFYLILLEVESDLVTHIDISGRTYSISLVDSGTKVAAATMTITKNNTDSSLTIQCTKTEVAKITGACHYAVTYIANGLTRADFWGNVTVEELP